MTKIILRIITVVLALITVGALVMIAQELIQKEKEKNEFNELAALVDTIVVETTDTTTTDDTAETDAETTPQPVFKRNLAPIFEKNVDCIGWIAIEGTSVNYPVMFTPSEPQKYLRKSFGGEYSISGTPFLQENTDLDCHNMVIYGHNMENGTMFSDITKYVDKSYVESYPIVEFETADGLKCYRVFAVVQLKSNDSWYGFVNAADENDYNNKIEEIVNRSLYKTDTIPCYGKQILTLSTCYGANSDDRLVVVCVEE